MEVIQAISGDRNATVKTNRAARSEAIETSRLIIKEVIVGLLGDIVLTTPNIDGAIKMRKILSDDPSAKAGNPDNCFRKLKMNTSGLGEVSRVFSIIMLISIDMR